MTSEDAMNQSCPGEFRVVGYEVRDFTGDYTCLDYGDPQAPRIARLREAYGLEDVVAGCETEFQGFLALKRWVRGRCGITGSGTTPRRLTTAWEFWKP